LVGDEVGQVHPNVLSSLRFRLKAVRFRPKQEQADQALGFATRNDKIHYCVLWRSDDRNLGERLVDWSSWQRDRMSLGHPHAAGAVRSRPPFSRVPVFSRRQTVLYLILSLMKDRELLPMHMTDDLNYDK
jgi:hypothetical protein